MIDDPEQKIARPRQIYTGAARRRLRADRASARARRRSPTTPCAARSASAAARKSRRVSASCCAAGSSSTVRRGAKVHGRPSTTSLAAVEALETEARTAATGDRLGSVSMLRDFEPGDRVAARMEISSGGCCADRPPGST